MSDGEPSPAIPDSLPNRTSPLEVADRHTWSGRQRILYAVLIIAFCALFIGGPLEHLLFGWLYFPLRVIPLVSIDWPTAILGLVSLLAFVFCLHRTILWFLENSSFTVGAKGRWSWRSTLVLALTLSLMFASGTAMVGATHQFIWLLTGRAARPGHADENPSRSLGLISQFIHDAREQAHDTQQKYKLKSIGLAMHNVHDAYSFFPPGGTMTESGELLHGWPIFLGNFMTYSHNAVDFSTPWNKPPNDRLFQCALHEFINPSIAGPVFDEQGYGLSHLAGNVHVLPICRVTGEDPQSYYWQNAARKSNQDIKLSKITDGTSNTILVGTAAGQFKPWGHPANLRDPALGINRDPSGFGGPLHWKGAMMLMCDGSVRILSNDTDLKLMKALGTPSGGENVGAEISEASNHRR